MIFVATIAVALPILQAALTSCGPAAGCIQQGEEEEGLLDFSLLQTSLQLSRGAAEQPLIEQAASQKRKSPEEHNNGMQVPASVLSELLSQSWLQTSLAPKLWLLPLGIILSFIALFVLRYYLNSPHSPDSDSAEPEISWGIYGILITQTLNALAAQVVMPTMPFYAMQIGASAVTISLLGSAYNLAQMFCSPLLGNASDQVGRKRVMLVGILCQAVCNSFLSFARTPNQLLVARAAVGVALSTGPVEGAYIMDFVHDKKQLKKVTQLQTFLTSAGALAGPVVARSFASLPFTSLCKGIVAINLLNFVIGCMLWEDKIKSPPKQAIEEESAGEEDTGFWQQVADMFHNPATLSLLIVSTLYAFSFNIGEGTEMVLFKDRFGFTKDDSCIFYMCINVTSLIGALWVPKLIEILGALNVCILGSFGGSLASLILVLGPQKTWVPYVFAVSIVGLCGSLVSLSYPLLVQEMCPENLGTLYGLQHSLNGAASAAASPSGGILYTNHQSLPFIASSVGFWLTGMFYGGMSRRQRLPTPPKPKLERRNSALQRLGDPMYNDKLFMLQLQVKGLVFELDPEVRESYQLYKAHLQEEKGGGGKMPVSATIADGLVWAIERKKASAVDKSQLIEEGAESDPHVVGLTVRSKSEHKMPVAATIAEGFGAKDLVEEPEPSSESKTSASAGSDRP
eukprot:TRINITY_DN45031_c0_g1_i1.p1 TRINITY_DN45031_c0_g1~~TRINITY_DN45031_c0_g1_i1.p1  ORF type:complete len:683 (+),score=98.43 TRINITY_DN45031_c0_g1_i1:117-2165(+)